MFNLLQKRGLYILHLVSSTPHLKGSQINMSQLQVNESNEAKQTTKRTYATYYKTGITTPLQHSRPYAGWGSARVQQTAKQE